MKKILSIFLLIALALGGTVKADELVVANDTWQKDQLPIDSYSCDASQHNQFIYPATELQAMKGAVISGIKFHTVNASYSWSSKGSPTFTFKFAEVEATTLSGFITDASFTQVYQGQAVFANYAWDITLDAGYTYNGGNLLIDVESPAAGFISTVKFYSAEYANAGCAKGVGNSYLPKATFTYESPVSGPGLKVLDGTTKINSGYSYSFGLATAGTTKTFTLSNPGTEATPVAVAHTGSFEAVLSAASIPAGGEVTLTVTMPAASGSDVITISSTVESIDNFVINVRGTVRDASKFSETLLGGSIPEDWTSTGTWNWNTTNGASNTAWSESSNYRLITPQLTVAEGESFFFEVQGTYDNYQGIKFEYSTDKTTWTASSTTTSVNSSWQTFEINDVPAGKYYIALHGWHVNIRNFYGGSVPSTPKDITLDSKTTTSLTLSWTPAGSETAWKLEYSTNSDLSSSTIVDADSNPFELTGLDHSTKYYVRVRANAEGAEWSKVADFQTECGTYTIDATHTFKADFDKAELNAAPTCWEFINATATSLSTYPHIAVRAESGYFKGEKSLHFRNNSSKLGYAIFPVIENLSHSQITFSHREENTTNGGFLVLGYLTDIEDASTFDTLFVCTPTQSFREEDGIILSSVPDGARLAFQYQVKTSYYDAAVDDITVSLAPACAKPSDVKTTALDSVSATITWLNGGEETSWKLQYSTDNTNWTAANEGNAFTSKPFVLNGLTASTKYYVQVKAVCGTSDESDWSASGEFTTDCNAIDELNEAFSSSLPDCWKVSKTGGDYSWAVNSSYRVSASYSMNYYATAATTEYSDLITPNVNLGDKESNLTFYLKNDGYSGSVTAEVYIVVGETTTKLVDLGATSGWALQTIDLTAYASKTAKFIFRAHGLGAYSNIYIDDVAVVVKPCAKPTGLAAVKGNASAEISWTDESASEWNLRYRIVAEPENEWTTVNGLTAKPHTLESLTNGSEYEVQVQAACSATRTSDWTASVKFTPEACPTITSVTLGAKTYNSVVVNWATSSASNCDVRYKAAGDEDWTTVADIAATTKTLEGLTTGAVYTIAVKPSCGDDEAWVATADPYTPVYTEPEIAAASSITDAGATVSWGAVSDADVYEVALTLRKVAVSEWKATTKTDTTFSNLAAATEYDFFVRAKYATGESTADSIGFATITLAPQNLQQDGESTTDGATFTWEANGAATQYQWSIDNSNWSAAQTDLTATVEGLNPGSTYTFYVRSWYADNVYSSAISKAFDTKCATETLPFEQDFGSVSGTKPNCWNIANWGTSANNWTTASDFAKTGVALKYNAKTLNSADAITPSIEISDKCELNFYIRNSVGSGSAKVEAKVLVNDGTETKELADITTRYTSATLQTIDLSDYVGKTITIIFRGVGYDSGTNSNLWIDDITIAVKPCVTPTELAAAASKGSAVVTWTDDEADTWNLRYKKTADVNWEYVNNLDVKSHTLNGLAEESEYEVQVQAVCSATRSSEWTASVNFTPACPTPGAITFTNKTYNGVIVSWTAGGSETAWNLEYQKGETGWTPVLTNPLSTTSYTFTDLETGSPYSFRVQAACEGEWTAIANYTPQYSAPASASVTEPTDTTATASWAAVADAPNGYQYIVVEREATPDWDSEAVKSTTETSALLTKLAGLTDYDFYVRAVYGLNHGEATKAQFTTIAYAPQNLQQGATDTESAVFTWEANGAATQYQWSLDDTNWSAAQTALTAKVEGLSAGTAYTFYVRSYYADGKYSSSINLPFNTACDVESIGYTQDFEAGGKPLCWVVDDANWAETFSQGSTGNKWSNRGGSTTHSGNYALYYNSKTSTANSADITMPNIVIDKAAKLIFYIKNNYEVTGEVRVAAEEKETAITALKKTGNDFNTLQEIDLSDFVGKTVTITFHAQGAGTSENSSLAIDDIEVAPICTKPTNLAATATVGGADVTWDGDEDQYQYCVVNSGNDPSGWILLESYVKSVSITGKVEGKTYDVYVRAYCGAANQSEAVMTTFTTQSTPTGVDNVADDAKVIKLIENDQLVIIRDGIKYNAQGKRLGE